MIEKRKLESDKKLIELLFNTVPLDWARRDDGTLVFLYQDGRKMVVTPEDLAAMTDKKVAEKEAAQRKPAPGSSERTSGEVRVDTRRGAASGRTAVGHPAAKPAAAAATPARNKPK